MPFVKGVLRGHYDDAMDGGSKVPGTLCIGNNLLLDP